jgi:hypothetical protein
VDIKDGCLGIKRCFMIEFLYPAATEFLIRPFSNGPNDSTDSDKRAIRTKKNAGNIGFLQYAFVWQISFSKWGEF